MADSLQLEDLAEFEDDIMGSPAQGLSDENESIHQDAGFSYFEGSFASVFARFLRSFSMVSGISLSNFS
jgi:hypothetical protein